jgi:hypothetical protein
MSNFRYNDKAYQFAAINLREKRQAYWDAVRLDAREYETWLASVEPARDAYDLALQAVRAEEDRILAAEDRAKMESWADPSRLPVRFS